MRATARDAVRRLAHAAPEALPQGAALVSQLAQSDTQPARGSDGRCSYAISVGLQNPPGLATSDGGETFPIVRLSAYRREA
jgi:hypothetical protein